jgi:hypothetical protein
MTVARIAARTKTRTRECRTLSNCVVMRRTQCCPWCEPAQRSPAGVTRLLRSSSTNGVSGSRPTWSSRSVRNGGCGILPANLESLGFPTEPVWPPLLKRSVSLVAEPAGLDRIRTLRSLCYRCFIRTTRIGGISGMLLQRTPASRCSTGSCGSSRPSTTNPAANPYASKSLSDR